MHQCGARRRKRACRVAPGTKTAHRAARQEKFGPACADKHRDLASHLVSCRSLRGALMSVSWVRIKESARPRYTRCLTTSFLYRLSCLGGPHMLCKFLSHVALLAFSLASVS